MSEPLAHSIEALISRIQFAQLLERFVQLWTWFKSHPEAFDVLRTAGVRPDTLEPHSFVPTAYDAHPAVVLAQLLQYIMWLDGRSPNDWHNPHDSEELPALQGLAIFTAGQLAHSCVTGSDGTAYRVLRSFSFPLASRRRYHQHRDRGSIESFARYHRCIRFSRPTTLDLVEPTVSGRLLRRSGGSFLCYPLGTALRLAETVRNTAFQITVSDADENEKLVAMLTLAERRRARVVLLPELSVSARGLAFLKHRLQYSETQYPCLIVVGLEHSADGAGVIRNQVVGLDSAGRELFHQFKQTNVLAGGRQECHTAGHETTILPAYHGVFLIAICRDLLDAELIGLVQETGPAIVLCPSLSAKTTEHITAARSLAVTGFAATLVSNRWPAPSEWVDGLPDWLVGQSNAVHTPPPASFVLVPGARIERDPSSPAGSVPDDLVVAPTDRAPLLLRWNSASIEARVV